MPLKIMPHGRLQEWVAEEKGYFAAEGLDYTFVRNDSDYGIHTTRRDDAGEIKTGAFETFGAGRDGADLSCARHWATKPAAGPGGRPPAAPPAPGPPPAHPVAAASPPPPPP